MKPATMALVAAGILIPLAQAASAITALTAFLTDNQVNPPTGSTNLMWAWVLLNHEQNSLAIQVLQVPCAPPCLKVGAVTIDVDGTKTPNNPDDDVPGIHIDRGAPGISDNACRHWRRSDEKWEVSRYSSRNRDRRHPRNACHYWTPRHGIGGIVCVQSK
jgi:hypothetical protein